MQGLHIKGMEHLIYQNNSFRYTLSQIGILEIVRRIPFLTYSHYDHRVRFDSSMTPKTAFPSRPPSEFNYSFSSKPPKPLMSENLNGYVAPPSPKQKQNAKSSNKSYNDANPAAPTPETLPTTPRLPPIDSDSDENDLLDEATNQPSDHSSDCVSNRMKGNFFRILDENPKVKNYSLNFKKQFCYISLLVWYKVAKTLHGEFKLSVGAT